MNAYNFQLGKEDIRFAVDSVKYLLGDNYKTKYTIKKTLEQTFNKVDNSEFAVENNLSRRCLLNDKPLDIRNCIYFNVNHSYDFLEDMKLKTSSLFHNYLVELVKDIEYSDTFNTLSILFSDLAEELNHKLKSSTEYTLDVSMKPLNSKSLIKWIELDLTKSDETINPYDLSYEECILFQVNTIQKLAGLIPEKLFIVYLETIEVSQKLRNALNNAQDNLNILVDAAIYNNLSIENVVWLNQRQNVDFSDEIQIYEKLTMNHETHCTVEDTKIAYEKHIESIGRSIGSLTK